MRALKVILLFLIVVLSSACAGSDHSEPVPTSVTTTITGPVPDSKMSRINIPAREHGYASLQDTQKIFTLGKHKLISSQPDLEALLSDIQEKQHWNGNSKQRFSEALRSANVDFSHSNILIYFHNEGSGSNRVSVTDPVWKDSNALCKIISKKPGEGMMGTADMAYYAYAWTVSKDIPNITFEVSGKRVDLLNQ